jgi:hypothetical protein
MDPLASFWTEILSRDAARTQVAFATLNAEEQGDLIAHLQRMATEIGWHEEQAVSAHAALAALNIPAGSNRSGSASQHQ